MRLLGLVFIAAALTACAPSGPATDAAKDMAAKVEQKAADTPITKDTVVTAGLVKTMLDAGDPTKVVQALDAVKLEGDVSKFDDVLKGVAEGSEEWLALVPALKNGTDGATGESLTIALSTAIAKNPAGVLKRLGGPLSIGSVCAVTLIEPTPQEANAFRAAAVKALESVTDPGIESSKLACLAGFKG